MFFNEEDKKIVENDNNEIKKEEDLTQNINSASNDDSNQEVKKEQKSSKAGIGNTSDPVSEEFLPKNFNPFARPINPKFANKRESEFEERVLEIKRVIKVTKGGRRFKFSALVVVGDKKGRVGYAIGKHIEVPEAIKKAIKHAKKNLVNIKVVGKQNTIPHEVIGHAGAARVMLKPAIEGKGVIASDVVRAVVELAGIRNIYSKNLGTNNPGNVVRATVLGLLSMRTSKEIFDLKSLVDRRLSQEKKSSFKKPMLKSQKEIKGE